MSQTLTSHAYLNKKPLVLPGAWVVWWPLSLQVIYCLPLGESQSYKIHPSVISSPKCSMPCSCECEKGRAAFCCAWVLVCGLLIMILHQRLSVSRWPISKFRQPFSNQNRTLLPVCVTLTCSRTTEIWLSPSKYFDITGCSPPNPQAHIYWYILKTITHSLWRPFTEEKLNIFKSKLAKNQTMLVRGWEWFLGPSEDLVFNFLKMGNSVPLTL